MPLICKCTPFSPTAHFVAYCNCLGEPVATSSNKIPYPQNRDCLNPSIIRRVQSSAFAPNRGDQIQVTVDAEIRRAYKACTCNRSKTFTDQPVNHINGIVVICTFHCTNQLVILCTRALSSFAQEYNEKVTEQLAPNRTQATSLPSKM